MTRTAGRSPTSSAPTYFEGLATSSPAISSSWEFEHDTPQAIAEGRGRGRDLFFRRLASALEDIGDGYDVVVIDCPPQLGYLTLGRSYAATGLLVTSIRRWSTSRR